MKILPALAALAVFAVVFIVSVRYIEKRSIFFPMKEVLATPEVAGFSYEDVYFSAADGTRLNGWYIPADATNYTVLFCHGNAGNISHRLEKISMFHEMGLNMFIFDYRGYGKSEGSPSEKGLYADALGAHEYLLSEKKIPADKIILYGESLGSAVIIEIAGRVNARAIITEEAFSSVRDMAKIAYPFLPYFVFSSRFDSAAKIKKIGCPKLIIHSPDDEIVPYYLGEKLYREAAPPKEFLKIRGAHNTAFIESEHAYTHGIRTFVEGLR